MNTLDHKKTIDDWIAIVRLAIETQKPELLQFFDTYAAESKFGRQLISPDLDKLATGSNILEVGAGSLLLSTQLVREGYCVTALEPVGQGFGHFNALQTIVLALAEAHDCLPEISNVVAERFVQHDKFDYAFSINVMEHVEDYALVILNVVQSLAEGGWYHFICPNYSFWIETHFNLPIILNKPLTYRLFEQRIVNKKTSSDSIGLWQSLNWIKTKQVKKLLKAMEGCDFTFENQMFEKMLLRSTSDLTFRQRRPTYVNHLIDCFVKLKLHKLTRLFPVNYHPNIDCRIIKR